MCAVRRDTRQQRLKKKGEEKKVNSWRKESEEHSVQAGALLSLLMKLEKKSVDAFNVGEEYW